MNKSQTPEFLPAPPPSQRLRIEIAPKTIAAVVLTAAVLWVLGQLVAILVVIACALILMGTLQPFVAALEKRGVKRLWAVTIVSAACAGVAGLFVLITIPPLWDEVSQIVQNLPEIQTQFANLLQSHTLTEPLARTVRSFGAGKAAANVNVTSALAGSVWLAEHLGYAASAIVLAVYLMADPDSARGMLFALVPRRYHVRLARILLNLEPIVGGYMRGQVITSLAIAVFTFGLLFFCGIPNALALAAFAGLADVLPFVGGLLATVPAALTALSKGTGTATIVLIALVCYQEFENRVLVPRVYGRVLRLPPAAVVLSLMMGGKLGGILGALLALPLAAAVRMLIEELRLDLPGDNSDDHDLKQIDAQAERSYERQSDGASPEEAAAVATRIAHQIDKDKVST